MRRDCLHDDSKYESIRGTYLLGSLAMPVLEATEGSRLVGISGKLSWSICKLSGLNTKISSSELIRHSACLLYVALAELGTVLPSLRSSSAVVACTTQPSPSGKMLPPQAESSSASTKQQIESELGDQCCFACPAGTAKYDGQWLDGVG